MPFNKLTEDEIRVIEKKGTERPFSGKYNDFYDEGIFTCKKCNTKLYTSKSKFNSGCGWPSFDDDLGSVKRVPDADGRRVEIICETCGAHLGHVFEGEGFTKKNTRHCVNSISLNFEEMDKSKKQCEVGYFAAGCFWGVEYYFEHLEGVYKAISGYMGGDTLHPDYNSVCTGMTGHLEVVKVEYDKSIVSYEDLVKLFFEIHDFTQTNGQGPDIGSQYLSAIFYKNSEQKKVALELIDELENKKYKVATTLREAGTFYKAEDYHQDYYDRHKKMPYCHRYKKIF